MEVWSFTQHGCTTGSPLFTDTETWLGGLGFYLLEDTNPTACILTTLVLKMAKTVSTFISFNLAFIPEEKKRIESNCTMENSLET